MMDLRIELYGVLQRLAGVRDLMLELPEGATAADALAQLQPRSAELVARLAQCACAIGDRIVTRDEPLIDGSTLVLIPPVSGG
ncbi:MAG TPA: MoaD/ThiS family protein [Solimonas sp.]|nr:MoaD/ThiS family protein [Solimonas sp.]